MTMEPTNGQELQVTEVEVLTTSELGDRTGIPTRVIGQSAYQGRITSTSQGKNKPRLIFMDEKTQAWVTKNKTRFDLKRQRDQAKKTISPKTPPAPKRARALADRAEEALATLDADREALVDLEREHRTEIARLKRQHRAILKQLFPLTWWMR